MSQGLDDFYSLMDGKSTTNSKFIKRIKKTMDNYRKTEEWSEHVMNTEQIKEMALAQGVEEGKREATVSAISKTVKMLKRMNQSNEQILQELKQDYSDEFSDEELEEFLK